MDGVKQAIQANTRAAMETFSAFLMDGLKQAMVTNTKTALERAIKNAEIVTGYNPPELRIAKDMLKAMVGSGQSWGRIRVKGLGSGSG